MSDADDRRPVQLPDSLPQHESGLRRLMADAHGLPYHPLRSLEEARAYPDGLVILEGDWGGQIYTVCPASMVGCAEDTLGQLLRDLDAIAWPENDPDGAKIFYERRPVGAGVPGGMGGGAVTADIWVHDEFIQAGLDLAIRDVIEGRRTRLGAGDAP